VIALIRLLRARFSEAEVLSLTLSLRPIRWVWTDKMLSMGGAQLDGYVRGTDVFGLDACNVQSVLSEPLRRAGLEVVVKVDPVTGFLTVRYRLVALMLFVAIGAANARYRALRPRLKHLVPHSGLRPVSRWRLLVTPDISAIQYCCHDHLTSLKWFVGRLQDLESKLQVNADADLEVAGQSSVPMAL